MKFGKEFKKQQVPEWLDAYMDYDGFKKMLKKMRILKPNDLNREPFYRTFLLFVSGYRYAGYLRR